MKNEGSIQILDEYDSLILCKLVIHIAAYQSCFHFCNNCGIPCDDIHLNWNVLKITIDTHLLSVFLFLFISPFHHMGCSGGRKSILTNPGK